MTETSHDANEIGYILVILYIDLLLQVRDMEEDAKRIKIMLNLREEKVGEMEFCTPGPLMTKECLIEENKTLKGEIKLLRDSIDKNPELTRSALENTKLWEQLQR